MWKAIMAKFDHHKKWLEREARDALTSRQQKAADKKAAKMAEWEAEVREARGIAPWAARLTDTPEEVEVLERLVEMTGPSTRKVTLSSGNPTTYASATTAAYYDAADGAWTTTSDRTTPYATVPVPKPPGRMGTMGGSITGTVRGSFDADFIRTQLTHTGFELVGENLWITHRETILSVGGVQYLFREGEGIRLTETGIGLLDQAMMKALLEPKEPEVEHKGGHAPISWMAAAHERASQSESCFVVIQIEGEGIAVIGQDGDAYETHIVTWEAMDQGRVNPLIAAIEKVERHLATLDRLKEMVA